MALSIYNLSRVVLAAACLCALTVSPSAAAKKKGTQYQSQTESKPLRGVIRYQGGYSYSQSQATGTNYMRFVDPSYSRQTTSGPFDNGFFFDSGIGPRGGESPYQR